MRKVLLFGLPGAGVTTVGGVIATRLGWPFLNDTSVLERTGSPTQALTLLLAMPGQLVAGVPDALIDDAAERVRLAGAEAHRVWLRCSIPILARRVGARFDEDAAQVLRRLAAERNALYEDLADQVVDTDAHPAGAAAKLVIAALEG